jgi:hypothetical protein
MPRIAILKWSLRRTHRRKDHGMERNECSGRGRKGKHLTREERVDLYCFKQLRVLQEW